MTDTMQNLSYNDLGRVIANNRSGNAGDIRYAYDDLHGWVTGINSGAGFEQRMYRETNGAHSRWDGSISAMSWRTDEKTIHRYDYEYDGMNRLTKADYSSYAQLSTVSNASRTSSSLSTIRNTAKKASTTLQSLIPVSESASMLSLQVKEDETIVQIDPIVPADPLEPIVDDFVKEEELVSIEKSAELASMKEIIVANLAFSNTRRYNEEIAYNANSSITSLKRYGLMNSMGYGLIDNLSFSYKGNQRTKVTDNVTEYLSYNDAFDFVDGTNTDNDYRYNENGALDMDQNKGISNIEYDLLGNPLKVKMSDNRSIEYVYSADGRRLRTTHKKLMTKQYVGLARSIPYMRYESETFDYYGNLILKNNKPQMYRFSGGYYDFKDDGSLNDSHYYIADYMGNNRMVVNGRTGAVEQVNHYYPYGGIIAGISTGQDKQAFKFEDKELDRTYGLDWYDIQARQYDALAPTWNALDPFAEKYYRFSPYVYCAGDPVNLVDPTGLFPQYNWDTGKYYDSDTKEEVSWDQVQNYISTGNYDEQCKETEKNVSPWQLGVEWLTGIGPRERVFGNDDLMSQMLSEHDEIQNIVTEDIINKIKKGRYYDRFSYSLRGLKGVPKYLRDYSILFTNGLTGNLAVTYLGSYHGNWSVLKFDETSAIVLFEVTNQSTFASGTRPPVLGYTNYWMNNIAPKLNSLFSTGPMSPTQQRIIWTKTINL